MRFHFPDFNPSGNYAADGQRHQLSVAMAALRECQERGTIAKHVGFKTLDERGRRGTGIALEIQLEGFTRDRGRRAGNTGSYGASTGYGGDGTYAATYDEWGFLIAAMYRLAAEENGPGEFFVGSAKYKVYADSEDFHHKTGRTYDDTYPKLLEEWEATVDEDAPNYGRIDDYRYRSGRNQIGRRGYGRVHVGDNGTRWAKLDIRSPEWLRAFQNGEVF